LGLKLWDYSFDKPKIKIRGEMVVDERLPFSCCPQTPDVKKTVTRRGDVYFGAILADCRDSFHNACCKQLL
jgi:hypothetical protein